MAPSGAECFALVLRLAGLPTATSRIVPFLSFCGRRRCGEGRRGASLQQRRATAPTPTPPRPGRIELEDPHILTHPACRAQRKHAARPTTCPCGTRPAVVPVRTPQRPAAKKGREKGDLARPGGLQGRAAQSRRFAAAAKAAPRLIPPLSSPPPPRRGRPRPLRSCPTFYPRHPESSRGRRLSGTKPAGPPASQVLSTPAQGRPCGAATDAGAGNRGGHANTRSTYTAGRHRPRTRREDPWDGTGRETIDGPGRAGHLGGRFAAVARPGRRCADRGPLRGRRRTCQPRAARSQTQTPSRGRAIGSAADAPGCAAAAASAAVEVHGELVEQGAAREVALGAQRGTEWGSLVEPERAKSTATRPSKSSRGSVHTSSERSAGEDTAPREP